MISKTLLIWISVMLGQLYVAPVYAQKLNVFACEPEWAALANALAGEYADIYSATTHAQDPHRVQARPSLIAKARQADLLICSGAGLEQGWLPLLLRKSANGRIQQGQPGHFLASQFVPLLGKPERLDRSMGDVHGEGNPHMHLNPHYMLTVAKAFTDRLVILAPANEAFFRSNHETFEKSVKSFLAQEQALIDSLHALRIIVHHDSWLYFSQWLGLEQIATLEAKPGLPPSTAHLGALLESIKAKGADLIIYSSYQDPRSAQWLSKRSGLPVVELPYSVRNWREPAALTEWYKELLVLLQEVKVSKQQ